MKKLQTMIALLIFSSVVCYSQTAKVIALSESDADAMATLYKQQQDIQDKITKLTLEIEKRYIQIKVECKIKDNMTIGEIPCQWDQNHSKSFTFKYKTGWGSDFEFTEDFKYIVPLYNLQFENCYHSFGSSPVCSSPNYSVTETGKLPQ